jgi:hypothetical protein
MRRRGEKMIYISLDIETVPSRNEAAADGTTATRTCVAVNSQIKKMRIAT